MKVQKVINVFYFHRDEEVVGVDPTIFRRYLREAEEEDVAEDEINETVVSTTTDKRTEVNDYKMPRRKTTRRKKGRRQSMVGQDCTE